MVLLVSATLVVGLGGCADDDPPRDVLTFCDPIPASAGPSGQDRFVVTFEPGSDLAEDGDARTALYAAATQDLCIELSEVGPDLTDAVVVRSDRLLHPTEQARLVRALQADPDVLLAQPDSLLTPDATPDGTTDGQGTR